jgi:3-dehydroquinate synthase
MLHFYLIAGRDKLAASLMNDYETFLNKPEMLKKFILSSLKIKKEVIEDDEFDKGKRNIFNYGHTFGHALETVSSYAINHGQAVTMGMDIANYVSYRYRYINKSIFEGMHSILSANLPNFKVTDKNIDIYIKALSRDKKNLGNNLGCILTKGPGSMTKVQVPMGNKFRIVIKDYFNLSAVH